MEKKAVRSGVGRQPEIKDYNNVILWCNCDRLPNKRIERQLCAQCNGCAMDTIEMIE